MNDVGRNRPTGQSIRSKVAAAMLVVALVPLIVVALVAYRSQRDAAERQAVDSLAGIAAVQEARVNAYATSNLESLALVASRTQLRLSFAAQLEAPDGENVALMRRILGDAAASSQSALRIELVSLEGEVIASSDGEELGADRTAEPAFVAGLSAPDVSHIVSDGDSRHGLHAGPVMLQGTPLGVVLIEASLEPLDELVTDYTGLGDSGETILATDSEAAGAQVLAPVRFPDELDDPSVIAGTLLIAAFGGAEGTVEGQPDYRLHDVFAVARNIDVVPEWALAVKIDRSEALADASRLRTLLLVSLTAAAAAVIGAALFLARTLSRPVSELHQAATAVAAGDTERRARILSNDETADLARAFNQMTDELTAANARLRLTNEQLEEFVYISSHDLKSPLRSISSFGQLLQVQYESVFDDQGREYLTFIRDGAARMHAVIEDLLEYLRIEKQGHVVEPVDLDPLVDDILGLHRPRLDEVDAEIRRSELPVVEGSSALLRQLFDNVIQNAIRYRTPNRPLLLDISATADDEMHQITLADNGIGIDPARREEAFDVFHRLSDTGDGSGMGLAICRRIVRRHGGEIQLTDSAHGGVAVVVRLPMTVVGADRPQASAEAEAELDTARP